MIIFPLTCHVLWDQFQHSDLTPVALSSSLSLLVLHLCISTKHTSFLVLQSIRIIGANLILLIGWLWMIMKVVITVTSRLDGILQTLMVDKIDNFDPTAINSLAMLFWRSTRARRIIYNYNSKEERLQSKNKEERSITELLVRATNAESVNYSQTQTKKLFVFQLT